MKRLATAILLIAVAVYVVFFAPGYAFIAAAMCMGLLCYYEFSGLVAQYGIQRPGLMGVCVGVLILLLKPEHTLLGVVLLVVVSVALSLRKVDLRQILPQASCAFFGAFYTFAPWRFAFELRKISVHLLFFALALNWVGDTAAYYIGRKLGRHKLAPVVSPKKTWEGAIASIAFSVVFGILYLGNVRPQLAWAEIAIMAVIGNIAGQLGDLAESAIKRGAGVKDSGNLLPGHGGMLDRVDSSLFSLPVIYGIYLLGSFIWQ